MGGIPGRLSARASRAVVHAIQGWEAMSEKTAAFEGFLLALRVLYHVYEIDEPAAAFEKPWAVLLEIAEGRLTLSNPADLAARYPGVAAFVYERANRMVASDRETASLVLQGMQEGLGGLPGRG